MAQVDAKDRCAQECRAFAVGEDADATPAISSKADRSAGQRNGPGGASVHEERLNDRVVGPHGKVKDLVGCLQPKRIFYSGMGQALLLWSSLGTSCYWNCIQH